MIKCPACAGPQALGGDCATCLGVTEVTQEVYEQFFIEEVKLKKNQKVASALSSFVKICEEEKLGDTTLYISGSGSVIAESSLGKSVYVEFVDKWITDGWVDEGASDEFFSNPKDVSAQINVLPFVKFSVPTEIKAKYKINFKENSLESELIPTNKLLSNQLFLSSDRLKKYTEMDQDQNSPIWVWKTGDFFQVIDGNHRAAAAIARGDEKVWARVVE